MRTPRVRFTVRGMMLAVVFVGIGVALALQGVFAAIFEEIVRLWLAEATADHPEIGFTLIATSWIGIGAIMARRKIIRLRLPGESIGLISVASSLILSAVIATVILLAAGCAFVVWAYLFTAFYLGVGSHTAWPDVAFDWHQRETVTTGLTIAIAATWRLRRRSSASWTIRPASSRSRLMARRFVVAAAVASVSMGAEVMRRRRETFLGRAARAGQLARDMALDVPPDRSTIESYRQIESKYAPPPATPGFPSRPTHPGSNSGSGDL